MKSYLEMQEINKTYRTYGHIVMALKGVNLNVKKGTVHAVLGENGAGKTTLMEILVSVLKKDSGTIYFRGQKLEIENPFQAFAQGIGMVHQHFSLIKDFTVAENIVLGVEPVNRIGITNSEQLEKKVLKFFRESGFVIDPSVVVGTLSMGQRQKVEILRILYRGADLLILDEPTSVLAEQEVKDLFRVVNILKKQGKTIIFITHKVKEVLDIADEITVLREGRTVGKGRVKDFDKKRIVQMIMGESISLNIERIPPKKGKILLSVQGLSVKSKGDSEKVKDISFNLRKGEITVIAGVSGSGQKELVEAIFGLRQPSAGKVLVEGKDITNLAPRDHRKMGISYIPEDRMNLGSSLNSSLIENIIVDKYYKLPFSKRGWMQIDLLKKYSERLVDRYNIKIADVDSCVGNLSGGNIQRVIIARELNADSKILITQEPTMGLDLGSTKYVYNLLLEMRKQGKAILLLTSDMDEVIGLSDKILVMYQGEIVVSLDNNLRAISKDEIGEYMLGIKRQNYIEQHVSEVYNE